MSNFRRRLMMQKKEDIFNGHEYVDLGLPSGLLWAKCNVGAASEEEYGNHYSYGSIIPWESGSNDARVYYNGSESPLPLAYDTARLLMGGMWRIPTREEFQELINNTDVTAREINGVVYGEWVSKTNGKSILLPNAGSYDYYGNTMRYSANSYMGTSSPDSNTYYYRLSFYTKLEKGAVRFNRNLGSGVKYNFACSIRGVISPV